MKEPHDEFCIDPNELHDIVALCDADGIIVSWNHAGRQTTGFTEEDLRGYHLDSVVSQDSHARLAHLLRAPAPGGTTPEVTLRLLTNCGIEVPVEATSIPRYKDGALERWLVIFRDVALKVQQRDHLDRLDVLYRSLVENSPAIVYVLDSQGRVMFINDRVETLLGYTKADLMGKELISIVHPEDRDRAYWPLRERRRFPRATQNCEFRLITREGVARQFDLDYLYVSLNSIGLKDPLHLPSADGDMSLGTQGIARDITELVLLQEFSRQVSVIYPICTICRRIRVNLEGNEEWLSLDSYLARRASVQFSHTYCPDHMPEVG